MTWTCQVTICKREKPYWGLVSQLCGDGKCSLVEYSILVSVNKTCINYCVSITPQSKHGSPEYSLVFTIPNPTLDWTRWCLGLRNKDEGWKSVASSFADALNTCSKFSEGGPRNKWRLQTKDTRVILDPIQLRRYPEEETIIQLRHSRGMSSHLFRLSCGTCKFVGARPTVAEGLRSSYGTWGVLYIWDPMGWELPSPRDVLRCQWRRRRQGSEIR